MHTSTSSPVMIRQVHVRDDDVSRRSVPFLIWSHAVDPHWMRANLPIIAGIAANLVIGSCKLYDAHTSTRVEQNEYTGLPTVTITIWESHEICKQLRSPLVEVKVFMVGPSKGRSEGASLKVECTHIGEHTGAADNALDKLTSIFQTKKPEFDDYVRGFLDACAKGTKRKG